MTTRKGNPKKGAPRHQNRTEFKHNPSSKKTKKILAMPNEGLCSRCHEIIEWKKKYRKYKPLTTAKKCSSCQQKTITRAYHVICDPCARKQGVCSKCREKKQIVKVIETEEEKRLEQFQLSEALAAMSERERRAFYRSLEKKDRPDEDDSDGKEDGAEKDDEDEDDEEGEDSAEEEKVKGKDVIEKSPTVGDKEHQVDEDDSEEEEDGENMFESDEEETNEAKESRTEGGAETTTEEGEKSLPTADKIVEKDK